MAFYTSPYFGSMGDSPSFGSSSGGFDTGSFAASVGTNILGNVIGSYFGKKNAKHSAQASLEAQMALAKYINSNKHQWEVDDLRKAGLNPILSATNGSALGVGGVSANVVGGDSLSSNSTANSALDIQRKFNQGQIDVANRNAASTEKSVASQIVRNNTLNTIDSNNSAATVSRMKADELRTLNAIDNDNKETAAKVYNFVTTADAATTSAAAAYLGASTGRDMFNANKDYYKYRAEYTKNQSTILGNNPHAGKYGKQLGYVDYGLGTIGKLVGIGATGVSAAKGLPNLPYSVQTWNW